MIQKIINKVMKPRHFWRNVGFNELSELYTSIFLRSLATNLMGLFVPIYLHGLGYSVRSIFIFYIVFFGARVVFDVVSAFIVGRVGPKHSIAISTIGSIVYLGLLLTISTSGWPVYTIAPFGAATMSLFFVAFNTDFSKVKDSKNGGKEVGYLTTFEKLGGIAGPLLGGVIATVFDPRYTIALAIVLFGVSLVPLFKTNEQVRLHQRITVKGFRWRVHAKEFASYSFFATENIISILVWNFYLSLTVFKSGAYAKIGIITALSTAVSLLAIKIVGITVDKKDGRKLLNAGVLANSAIHLLRVIITTPLGVLGVNIINDPITVAYRMPFSKQFYDQSDTVPGFRILYIAINEVTSNILKMLVWVGLLVASSYVTEVTAMKGAFIVAAVFSLGIALQPKAVNNQE